MAFRYLRPEDIARLDNWEFAPRSVAEGYLAGRHRSRRQGLSTEFRDHRPYSPGDDIRALDWRVYARTEKPFLRTFEIETSTDCHLIVDSSASMGFGETITKLTYGSFLAAALAYLAVKGKDHVSLHLVDAEIRQSLPAGSTHRHLHNVLRSLEANQPGQTTRLSEVIRRTAPLLKRRGLVVIISDFLDDTGSMFESLNILLGRGFKIHLVQILDPVEIDFSLSGLLAFDDLETGKREIAHAEHLRDGYREAIDQHIRGIRDLATRRQMGYRLADTRTSFYDLLEDLVQ